MQSGAEPVSPAENRERCLIVEDSALEGKISLRALESLGYEAQLVKNGCDALEIISSGKQFKFVLSDIVMPGMSGLKLLEQVRSMDGLEDLPFILCTSLSDKETVVQALKLGCLAFVRKPYSVVSLKKKVVELLGEAQIRPRRVLVVNGSPPECLRLKKCIEANNGALVSFVQDDDDAKSFLQKEIPDLVLISLNLDGTKGHDLLEWVKNQPTLQHLPVVILSGQISQHRIARSYQLKASCHLIKPEDPAELASTLSNLSSFWEDAG